MQKVTLSVCILILGALILSCTPKTIPPQQPAPTEILPREAISTKKMPWQIEWEKTLEMGRKEGKVSIYSSAGNELRMALLENFPKKTGIALEMTTGKSAALTEKVLTERRNGLYLLDLFMSGLTSLLVTLKGSEALDTADHTLILPEVLDTSLWFGNELPFVDKEHKVLSYNARPGGKNILINADYIKNDEISSYRDLLKPQYKGKIVINDPTTTGSGSNWFAVAISTNTLGLDYMRDLAKQEPVLSRDERQQVEWVARGKYPIGIALDNETINEFQRAGSPLLDLFVKDEMYYITAGGANIALMNRAPHPNAAKVFINWLLSKEGQTLNSRIEGQQSRRLDIPTDHLSSDIIRDPKQKYFYANREEFHARRLEFLDMARQVFTPGVK